MKIIEYGWRRKREAVEKVLGTTFFAKEHFTPLSHAIRAPQQPQHDYSIEHIKTYRFSWCMVDVDRNIIYDIENKKFRIFTFSQRPIIAHRRKHEKHACFNVCYRCALLRYTQLQYCASNHAFWLNWDGRSDGRKLLNFHPLPLTQYLRSHNRNTTNME